MALKMTLICDHMRGVDCNLSLKEDTTTQRQALAEPQDKNRYVSCLIHFIAIFPSSKVLILTYDIAHIIINILKEQSSEENYSLVSLTQTWF